MLCVYVVYMCIYVYVHSYRGGMDAHVHTCVVQRRTLSIFYHSLPYYIETRSRTEPEAPHLSWIG